MRSSSGQKETKGREKAKKWKGRKTLHMLMTMVTKNRVLSQLS
jgi:hypothetical protein